MHRRFRDRIMEHFPFWSTNKYLQHAISGAKKLQTNQMITENLWIINSCWALIGLISDNVKNVRISHFIIANRYWFLFICSQTKMCGCGWYFGCRFICYKFLLNKVINLIYWSNKYYTSGWAFWNVN